MYFFFLASYEYTNDRNFYLEKLDYANGDSVQYEYDQQGRIIKQTYEDASYVTYDYDNSGALATVYDSETGISTTYYYDLIDRMMKYVESGNGYSHSVGYEYDTINNLTQMVETINGVKRTTSYGYDKDNRVTSITNDLTDNGTADGITESYTYDTHGRVATKVTKNGDATVLTESYEYVGDGTASLSGLVRKLTISSDSYSIVYEYTYDDNGNIASIGDGTAANTITYEYDAANQLVRENNPRTNKTYTWEYDNAGNILHENTYAYTTGTPGNATYTENYDYDDSQWGDLLTEWRNHDLSYDGIGNLTRDNQDNVYTWKNGRQLASYKEDGNEREDIYHFEYNADGLRTKAYNAYTTYNYIYNGSSLVQMTVDGSTLNFTYDMSGVPQTVTYNGTTYFYATNLQGDVTDILDSDGTVVVSYTYDVWGNHTSGNEGTGSLAATLGRHNPLRYRGYVYDVVSELYYLQSRYYSPEMGRFISADDPANLGADNGLVCYNLFAYCTNNPVNRFDANGNWSLPNWAKVAIGVGIIAAAAVVTVATGGAAAGTLAAAVHCAAHGALVGAVTQGAVGAVSGAVSGAVTHRITTGSWEGAGQAAIDGAADGFMSGTIEGAISGAVSSPYCFVAGTTVLTAAGVAAIETIRRGDMVWAWDEETGEVALKEVVETYVNQTDELVHVFVNGEEIVTTPSHPFYSPVKGWTDAVHLRAGDILVLVNGEYVIVEKVQHEILEAPVTVYNFQVEDFHTYYVTNSGVLVHNTCGGETAATKRGRQMHKSWDYGQNGTTFRTEVKIPGAGRADAVDFVSRIVYELKPNNPRAIREGWKQLTRYANALEADGSTWIRILITY